MLVAELDAWLRSLHPVADPTVDGLVTGDPDAEVAGVAVAWMPTRAALREARQRGCNVLVAHEPTYFAHHEFDGDPALGTLPPRASAALSNARVAKRDWIREHGMSVIRCHDVLDRMPGGIVDSLAVVLGFGDTDDVRTEPQRRVIRIDPPVPAVELARRLTDAVAVLGQPGVSFYGDPSRVVSSLGVGTGYDSAPWTFVELGAEMCVTIDDRIKTWIEGEWADDSGFPMIVIDHGTSEEPGVRRLAHLIADVHPDVAVELIRQGFGGRWLPASG